MNWQLLYWPVACLLLAWAQGWLMPAIRRTPPGAEAKRQDVALHGLLTAVYFLPLSLVPSPIGRGLWVALASRLLLFDVVLNYAAGSPAFAVGSTARFDRALRWLAARLGWPPERVRLVVWVGSLLLATLLAIHFAGELST